MIRKLMDRLLGVKPQQVNPECAWENGKLVVPDQVLTLVRQAKVRSSWLNEQAELIHAQVIEALGVDPESDASELVYEMVYDGLPVARMLERLEGILQRERSDKR